MARARLTRNKLHAKTCGHKGYPRGNSKCVRCTQGNELLNKAEELKDFDSKKNNKKLPPWISVQEDKKIKVSAGAKSWIIDDLKQLKDLSPKLKSEGERLLSRNVKNPIIQQTEIT